jgi:Mrp family chromosome partitioning ATPase
MSKRTTRFGERPPSQGEARGAPLPLVTQPMVTVGPTPGLLPVSDSDHGAPTRVQPAAEPTMALQPARQELARPATADRTPPEIGLTQHALPEDAPHDPRLVLVNEPDSERAAAFRVLRHHLLEAGRPQVVVVSSPVRGDGKTTTAVNLALALSECGRAKVLLVETHLRHPTLAQVFRFSPPWCFAEQLAAHRHQPMLPWGLIDIPQLWLHVAAVNPRIEQDQLLDAPAFAIAMERLRLGGYDHIVIDAPPVLGSADVNLMQDAADGVVFALRGQTSRARDLAKAVDQLSPAKIIGTVLLES